MFGEFVDFAKSILEKKDSEEIRKLVEEIDEISNEANEMFKKLEEEGGDVEELLKVEPKLRESLRKILELALSEEAFELAKHLAVLNGDIVKDVAEEIYSEKFEDYPALIDELLSLGILEDSNFTFRLSKTAKEILEDFEKEDYHRLAIKYYEKLTESLDNRAYLAYHCLKAGETDRALNLFIETANKLYGRHSCVDTLLEVGEKLVSRIDDNDTKCRVLGTLGNLYLLIKKYEEAEAYYKTVLNYYAKKAKEDPSYRRFVAGVLSNLGNLYFAKGELGKAENTYTECLKVMMEMEDEDGMIPILISLGDLYMAKEDYDNAEKCFHDALRIELKKSKEDSSRMTNVAMIVNNLGYLYSRKGDSEKAEKFYKEAIRLFGDLSKDDPDMLGNLVTALNNLSSLYMNTGNVDSAMDVLEAIKEYWDVIPPDVKATFYMNLARGLESKGDAKAAEFYLKAGALGFMIFRNYGITAINFMHCFDKAEQLGKGDLKGDAKLIKSVIMRMYYGVKSELPEVERYSKRGEIILKASNGERIENIELKDEVDMAVYILANELLAQKRA